MTSDMGTWPDPDPEYQNWRERASDFIGALLILALVLVIAGLFVANAVMH